MRVHCCSHGPDAFLFAFVCLVFRHRLSIENSKFVIIRTVLWLKLINGKQILYDISIFINFISVNNNNKWVNHISTALIWMICQGIFVARHTFILVSPSSIKIIHQKTVFLLIFMEIFSFLSILQRCN